MSLSDSNEIRIGLHLAQEELAQLLGASRQRVNQELKSMEREEVIRIEPGGLIVRDRGDAAAHCRHRPLITPERLRLPALGFAALAGRGTMPSPRGGSCSASLAGIAPVFTFVFSLAAFCGNSPPSTHSLAAPWRARRAAPWPSQIEQRTESA
jgi:hypothetical protein